MLFLSCCGASQEIPCCSKIRIPRNLFLDLFSQTARLKQYARRERQSAPSWFPPDSQEQPGAPLAFESLAETRRTRKAPGVPEKETSSPDP